MLSVHILLPYLQHFGKLQNKLVKPNTLGNKFLKMIRCWHHWNVIWNNSQWYLLAIYYNYLKIFWIMTTMTFSLQEYLDIEYCTYYVKKFSFKLCRTPLKHWCYESLPSGFYNIKLCIYGAIYYVYMEKLF